MINVNLRGRAGNQLFIYALARKLQLENKCQVIINDTAQKKERPDFVYDLDQFNISKDIKHVENRRFPYYADNDFLPIKAMRKLAPNFTYSFLQRWNTFLWLGTTYKPLNVDFSKDAYIDGFWQSYKYFDDIKEVLQKEITPKLGIPAEDMSLYNEIICSESVCVTVRRGDFLSSENSKMYYLCDEAYFEKCIAQMSKLVPNAKWFIFSDDVEWAKSTLKFPGEVFSESGKDSISVKLALMSACKHFIISNSSFSWWAQYLGSDPSKIVFSPSRWYANGWSDDMIMPNWNLIEV